MAHTYINAAKLQPAIHLKWTCFTHIVEVPSSPLNDPVEPEVIFSLQVCASKHPGADGYVAINVYRNNIRPREVARASGKNAHPGGRRVELW